MLKIKNKTDGKTNYFKNLPGKPMLCAYRHDSQRDRRGRDRLVVATTCATDAYHHYSFEFKSRSWRGVSDLIAKNRWFSPGTVVSSTNKTDIHNITKTIVESDVKHHKQNKTKPSCKSNYHTITPPKYYMHSKLYLTIHIGRQL